MFTYGNNIYSGATNKSLLIAERVIQGIRLEGLNIIINVIILDLIPLKERGNFIVKVLLIYFMRTSLGP